MRVLTGAIAALGLAGSAAAAQAQLYVETPPAAVYVSPAPPVVVAPPAPVVIAPAAPDYAYAPAPYAAYAYAPAPYAGAAVVVNSRTGRSCRLEPNGYRWCWTP
jgi:hypothetical protein